MGLKQIKDSDRIIFLKEFTKYIIKIIINEEKRKDNIEIEKLKKKFVEPLDSSKEIFNKIIKNEALEPSRYTKVLREKRKPLIYRENVPLYVPENKIFAIKKIIRPLSKTTKKPFNEYIKSIQGATPPIIDIYKPNQYQVQENQIQEKKSDISMNPMKKIEPLLRDSSILSIECPGPGKNVLVKRFNQINVTKIILSSQEINIIIEDYSNQARIPIVGGILKAAVGNSIISAVTSEFVGSRFIINKITPYSIIQNN